MDRLRTILFSLVFYALSVPIVLSAPVLALFGPRGVRAAAHGWAYMHRWAAHLMVLTVFLHMMRVFYHGAYKPPREFNWIVGVVLLFLTLGLSFTGYLLPWDQIAFWAVTVGSQMATYVPLVTGYPTYHGDVPPSHALSAGRKTCRQLRHGETPDPTEIPALIHNAVCAATRRPAPDARVRWIRRGGVFTSIARSPRRG